jgi:hypothetical protein
MDRQEAARQHLGAIVGRLVPRQIGTDTIEGVFFGACIDGMLTGRHELGDADAATTDIENPGVLDLLHRESERLISECREN